MPRLLSPTSPPPIRWALGVAVLAACVPEADVKEPADATVPGIDSGVDTADPPGSGLTHAIVSTVSEDYAVGALATVSLAAWAVDDELVDTSGDTVVRTAGDRVFRLNRYTLDTVQVYVPGDFAAPVSEFALADGANPHDVEMCGEDAFITQYGRADIAVVDPGSGLLVGAVDLSAHADADGIPEASTLVKAASGHLYVGLQNLDRDGSWASVGGAVAEIDCASRAVTRSWDFGDADVYADLADDTVVYVHEAAVGLHRLDPTTGTSTLVLARADVGAELVGLAAYDGRAVVATADAAGSYGIGCIDLATGAYTPVEAVDNYLISVDGSADGEAWISARTHWSNPEGTNGLRVFDIATCTERTSTGPISTVLAPFSVAFY